MNIEVITPARSASDSAVERIVLAVLDEISHGHRQGDETLLRSLRLAPVIADAVAKSDRVLLARTIAREVSDAIRIEIDPQALNSVLENSAVNTEYDRIIRELVDRGATQSMLEGLGFHIERKRFRELCKSVPGGYSYGRPPELAQCKIRHLHAYWASCAAPHRIDPIQHLVNTSVHLNIRLASIWRYLQEHPAGDNHDADEVPYWVRLMFPDWGSSG